MNLTGEVAKQSRFSQPHDRAAKLRLKHHDHRHRCHAKKQAVQIFNRLQVQPLGHDLDDQIEHDENEGDALKQPSPARAPEESKGPIDHHPDQQQLQQHLPPGVAGEEALDVDKAQWTQYSLYISTNDRYGQENRTRRVKHDS